MLAEKTEAPPARTDQRLSFFRQSGWLMIANVAGGALTYAVHPLNRYLPAGEYGSFGTLLSVVMVIPGIPLQMVLAQQTAKALATKQEGALSGIIRMVWWATSLVWLAAAVLVLAFQGTILARWKMTSPTGLWITLPIVLVSLWLPMFWGVLQGQQNFLWLGWTMIVSGIGRFVVAAVAVVVLAAGAAGMMAGVLFGIAAAVAIGAWQTRSLWLKTPAPFDRAGVIRQITPLLLAFLGFQVLFTADTMVIKGYFEKATMDAYVCAGTMSRALMWLVLPLATVMFPRLVHSAVKSEKTNLTTVVFFGTAVFAGLGALTLSLIGPFVITVVYPGANYLTVAKSILPWYASAMIPLALANVLLNNLLARPDSKLPLAICALLVSVGYIVGLTQFHSSLVMVLQTLGLSNLALLAVCAWFTWGPGSKPAVVPAA